MITYKLIKYQWRDAVRSRWLLVYTILFWLATDGLFRFSGSGDRVILGLLNLVLLLVPLVGVILGTMHVYQSREYVELMLTQPIHRKSLFKSLYFGLSLPLCVGLAVGISLPFLYNGALTDHLPSILMLIGVGWSLTFVFVGLAFTLAFRHDDRVKGIGLALGLWIFLAIIYDALVLIGLTIFHEYPLQTPALVLMMLNPLDLARVLLLLQFEASALMGFTGAVFQSFFGSLKGQLIAFGVLATWAAIPFWLCQNLFSKKHF